MVNLTPAQEKFITRLQMQKQKYDHDLAVLQAEFEVAKEQLKNPIRETVREAREAGVPTRRIHRDGLGWEQVVSMVNFLETKPETLSQRLKRLTQEQDVEASGTHVFYKPSDNKLELVSTGRNGEYRIIDREGDEWIFWILMEDYPHPVMEKGQDALAISDSAAEIREALFAKWPGLKIHGED